jgi:uncharacterized membrane protein YedE/YeeE
MCKKKTNIYEYEYLPCCFFIINYYYLYRKPLCNKVIMPIFLGNSNISYKENKNSITPYNALLFKNQRVGIGVNINSILNNSLEVNGDINIPSSSTYKINNANFGYSNLDHKLLAGTNISIGADFKVNNTYTLPTASGAVIGGIRVGNNLSILDGVLSAPSPYTLPTASGVVIGGIRVGNNLSIDASGILSVPSYTLPIASDAVIGGVRVGANLSITDGVLSAPPPYTLPTASGAVIGGIRVGNNLSITDGVLSAPPYTPYTLPIASDAVIGGVRVGANLLIDASGILSAPPPYTLPTASGAVLGGIRVGNNLSIDENSFLSAPPYTPYTLPTASDAVIGGVRVGDNLSITGGILSAPSPYTLPTASGAVLGGIRVGNNLSITDGVLSAPSPYTLLPTASTSVLGGIRVDGTTIAINAGVISYTGGIAQWGTLGNNIYNTNTLNVGIGTSNPQSKLHILEETDTSYSSTRTLIIQSTANSIIELIRGTSSDANRDFKIGNYTSTIGHYTYGDFIVKSSINGSDSDYIIISPYSDIYNFNNSLNWTQTSDRRIKENIEIASYDKCYENIDRLELKRFNYIKEFKTGNKDTNQLGFIAQEIKDIFPKSVFTNNYNSDELNIPDMHSIDMGQINYTLFGTVKKLMEINYDEEMRLKRLEDLLNIDPNTSNIEVTESVN